MLLMWPTAAAADADLVDASAVVDDASATVTNPVDDAVDAVDQTVDEVEQTVDQTVDQVEQTVDQTVDEVEQTVDQTVDEVADTVDGVAGTVTETAQTVNEASGTVDGGVDAAASAAAGVSTPSGGDRPAGPPDADLIAAPSDESTATGGRVATAGAAEEWRSPAGWRAISLDFFGALPNVASAAATEPDDPCDDAVDVICLGLLYGIGDFAPAGAEVLALVAMTGVGVIALALLALGLGAAGSGTLLAARRRGAAALGRA
jgi:hypothetical protein